MRKKIKWTLISVGSILLLLIGYYVITLFTAVNGIGNSSSKIPSAIKALDDKTNENPDLVAPKWEGTQRVNILVLGADARGLKKNSHEVPRSDSMMVISIEPNTKKALLISILRDTYVKIPGHGSNRINAAMALGGPTLAMKTVGDLLDIPIQYYVYMDFKGFIGVVDALGGVSIDVEKDMDWVDNEDDNVYDIHLKKGYQELDGKTALQYVRFRHDALSDISRTERQRKFLTAISEKMQSTSGILKLPGVLAAIDPYIETNINSLSEKMKLGGLGFDAKASGFVGIQVPPAHLLDDTRINGAAVLSTDPELLKAYIQDKFVESITGVIQPLDHLTPSATRRPTARPTTKPTATPEPIVSSTPTPSGDPVIPGDPIITEDPNQPTPTPDGAVVETPTPTPVLPAATPVPTVAPATPVPTPSPKPVIQAAG